MLTADTCCLPTRFQRPAVKQQQSIGAWADVLKTLALAAVVVNSTMVFFVGSQMACPHDESQVQSLMDLDPAAYDQIVYADRPTFAERKLGGVLCWSWGSPSSSARRIGQGDQLEMDGTSLHTLTRLLWYVSFTKHMKISILPGKAWRQQSESIGVTTWLACVYNNRRGLQGNGVETVGAIPHRGARCLDVSVRDGQLPSHHSGMASNRQRDPAVQDGFL
jgi:hypothetical protein